jgi:hypothetical protein
MKKILILACLCTACTLFAEVFSLWPFAGHDERMSSSAESLLNPAELWSEKIKVNGQDLEMKAALISSPLNVCLKLLREKFPDAKFAANDKNVVMERPLKNGGRERILLVSMDGIYPVMQFSMILPDHALTPKDWPREFPLLPGAKPVNVMYFPKRNAVYGMFKGEYPVRTALPMLTSRLQSSGWAPVSNENAQGTGTGEIFLNETKKEILIIGFTEDESGTSCLGTLYKRPYSK